MALVRFAQRLPCQVLRFVSDNDYAPLLHNHYVTSSLLRAAVLPIPRAFPTGWRYWFLSTFTLSSEVLLFLTFQLCIQLQPLSLARQSRFYQLIWKTQRIDISIFTTLSELIDRVATGHRQGVTTLLSSVIQLISSRNFESSPVLLSTFQTQLFYSYPITSLLSVTFRFSPSSPSIIQSDDKTCLHVGVLVDRSQLLLSAGTSPAYSNVKLGWICVLSTPQFYCTFRYRLH